MRLTSSEQQWYIHESRKEFAGKVTNFRINPVKSGKTSLSGYIRLEDQFCFCFMLQSALRQHAV